MFLSFTFNDLEFLCCQKASLVAAFFIFMIPFLSFHSSAIQISEIFLEGYENNVNWLKPYHDGAKLSLVIAHFKFPPVRL